jgi:hypothetical protein
MMCQIAERFADLAVAKKQAGMTDGRAVKKLNRP